MLHSFTRNYNDLSTDSGFQFEFFCDVCGNGYKSTFVRSLTYGQNKRTEGVGRAASALGGLLGGKANSLGWAVERGTDMIRGRNQDYGPQWREEQEQAFDEAQAEVKGYFSKCPSCGKWVDADCWNDEEGLCTDCAPRESAYAAQARNRAMRRNIDDAVENSTVWHGNLENRVTICPECGKPAGSGKFCNNCGAPISLPKCPNCGAPITPGLKFCGECGAPVGKKSGKCPNCGFENEPGTKFCGECGTKL